MSYIPEPQAFIDPFTGEQAFAVEPITNCPHALTLDLHSIQQTIQQYESDLFQLPCSDCHNKGENWLCLTCRNIYCSRYVKGHMAEHNSQNQDHFVAVSFSDLSFWCYTCDSYITNQDLSTLRRNLQKAKFNEQEPMVKYHKGESTQDTKQEEDNSFGFFYPGDIEDSKIYQTLIVKEFESDLLSAQKSTLKGYLTNEKKGRISLQNKEGGEVTGSVLLFSSKCSALSKEKIIFLLKEIEGYPNFSSLSLQQVLTSNQKLENILVFSDNK